MNKTVYIGVSGYAMSGKDLYCNIAFKLLNNLHSIKIAFADELKNDIDGFCKEKYNISSWTTNPEEKKIIRRILVAHGCIMREIGDGSYWIKKVEDKISKLNNLDVIFISDIRFSNEAHFIHSKNGWFIHLTKYTKQSPDGGRTWQRIYQKPPNEEEAKNDPLIRDIADYQLYWEDLSNNGSVKLEMNELTNNTYLKQEVFNSLKVCPSLTNILVKSKL